MSKNIRKFRRKDREDNRCLNFYTTAYYGIIARNVKDAKEILSNFIYGLTLDQLSVKHKLRIESLGPFVKRKKEEVMYIDANALFDWKPETDEEEEDPPEFRYVVKDIIEDYPRGIMYRYDN